LEPRVLGKRPQMLNASFEIWLLPNIRQGLVEFCLVTSEGGIRKQEKAQSKIQCCGGRLSTCHMTCEQA